ncbi:branched-chain amino acid transport system ATP-binding protein [Kaistia soli DSM 19436]|uniref:Branched-chain amino acid transport system ATP-binding protein n=1 Tax=Kaistia soli DSM 19436 TaxID=1122133 RepID=A0A1M4WZF7_9HYPH|nr:ABC transporter ATP-binding protein [Kaistia soli]SHE86517.1 branched-chain amino acid transport system ATP-binding protein [Kaistia soli DSM 19436]
MTGVPALVAHGIEAGYEPGLPIVKGASVTVGRGEIVVLLGPNGAGKSTLMKAIAGLVPIARGTVTLAGAEITQTAAHRMVRLGLAFVPQTENVFTTMSVEENLVLAGHVAPASVRAARLAAMLELFPDLARQRGLAAGRLSGGQRQMLAVARALMIEPHVLMLDEPSAGLSPKLVRDVFAKLVEIRASGVTILMVEQNARAALAIADRAYILADGRNRHEGSAAALAADPDIAEHYLGLGGADASVVGRSAP